MAVAYSQNGVIVKAPPTTVAISKRIDSEQGMLVVDKNGYIGEVITDYFPHVGNIYYNNFAIVINNADFSQSGLGHVTFITLGTADIGGRTYRTVNIGGVEWLAENLDYKFSGCSIGSAGQVTTPAACYYNDDEASYGIDGTYKSGLLYNWYAVKYLDDNRSTLCPGWHVPTRTEWNALITAVGGSSNAGTKLKSLDGQVSSNFPSGWGGTDDYGFGALPTGAYYPGFYDFPDVTDYWTSEPYDNTLEYAYLFVITKTNADVHEEPVRSWRGSSLRLVKDAT